MEKSLSLQSSFLVCYYILIRQVRSSHGEAIIMYKATPDHKPVYSPRQAFPLPVLPSDEWCDFRKDYEAGMTMKSIAEKYICDPRTVRKCLFQNKSSHELGRQTAPTKLAPYLPVIEHLYKELSAEASSFCMLSQRITMELHALGYAGSERTVRNHLRSNYQYKTYKEEYPK